MRGPAALARECDSAPCTLSPGEADEIVAAVRARTAPTSPAGSSRHRRAALRWTSARWLSPGSRGTAAGTGSAVALFCRAGSGVSACIGRCAEGHPPLAHERGSRQRLGCSRRDLRLGFRDREGESTEARYKTAAVESCSSAAQTPLADGCGLVLHRRLEQRLGRGRRDDGGACRRSVPCRALGLAVREFRLALFRGPSVFASPSLASSFVSLFRSALPFGVARWRSLTLSQRLR